MDIDLRLKELGAEPMEGDQFLPMKGEELAALEGKLAVRLPEAYREFLAKYGAVYFGPILMFRPVQPLPPDLSSPGEALFAWFYGSVRSSRPLTEMIDIYSKRMPESLIPIGNDGGDNQICLGIRGAETGKIYYWDHDNEWNEEYYINKGLPVPPRLKFKNVHLIAESFEDFMDRLYIADE